MDLVGYNDYPSVGPKRTNPLMYVALGFAILLVIIAFTLPRVVYPNTCLFCLGRGGFDMPQTIENSPPKLTPCTHCNGTGRRDQGETNR